MSTWASRTADKYITKKGNEPGSSRAPRTPAERAWREYAETVHRYLRRRDVLNDPQGKEALAAFERIGDGIALTEKGERA